MTDDILAFQEGREAAIAGKPRDGRRSADWLAGYDQVALDVSGYTSDRVFDGVRQLDAKAAINHRDKLRRALQPPPE